jgi:hypothetical protein
MPEARGAGRPAASHFSGAPLVLSAIEWRALNQRRNTNVVHNKYNYKMLIGEKK